MDTHYSTRPPGRIPDPDDDLDLDALFATMPQGVDAIELVDGAIVVFWWRPPTPAEMAEFLLASINYRRPSEHVIAQEDAT